MLVVSDSITQLEDAAFRRDLIKLIPYIRAFAISLCRDRSAGDDIAQEAVTRAWLKRHTFRPGTNLQAWVSTIVRRQFYTARHKAKREVTMEPGFAERTLQTNVNPTSRLELDDVRAAVNRLPAEQREALMLVVAGDLSYEQVAAVCSVPIGTIKSRVSRARATLLGAINGDAAPSRADVSFDRDARASVARRQSN